MTIELTTEGVIAAAALLTALGYLGKKLATMVKKAETVTQLVDSDLLARLAKIEELLESELTHNHGSSIKDDVYGLARGVGQMQRLVEEFAAQLSQVAAAQSRTDRRLGLVLELVEREDKQP